MADIEVARAVITIVPTMEGAQQSITEQLTGAASSSSVEKAGKTAGSNFAGGLAKGIGVATAATAAVSAAAVGAGKAFVSAAGDVAEYGDNIDKMSQKLGISAEAYQEWDFIAQHSGTSMESLKSSFKTLANAAQDGKTEFEALGISLEDAASMSTEDLFSAVISGLQDMEEGTERTALASTLLGKGATELGALLNTSAEDTEAMRQQVHDLGGVMSNEAVASAAAYQDSLQNLETGLSGLKNNFMADFLPGITGAMDGLTAIFTGDTEGGLTMISESIDEIVAQLTDNLPKLMEVGLSIVESLATAVMDNLPALADAALSILGSLATFVVENLPTLIEVGLNIMMTIADGIIENLPTIIPAVIDVILTIVDKLTDPDTIVKLVEAALQIMIALAQGLIEAIPKLIEKAPEIIMNLVEAIIRCLPLILDAGVKLVTTLAQGIMNTVGKVVESGTKIATAARDAIKGIIDKAKEWGKDLITNFVSGITAKIQAVKDAVGKVASTVKDFLGFSEPDEGPLSNFHTFAPDMLDLFSQGIKQNIGTIQDAMGELTGMMSEDMTATVTAVGTSAPALEYSDFAMPEAAGAAGDITIPVYLGTDLLDTMIVKANQRINLRSGGIA